MSRSNWIGQTLGGRYLIESLLGQGGMSAVYRAQDPNLRRAVAVKLIHSHLTGDPEFVRRFEAEAAAVARLRHPNIIQVYDFNHDAETYYMVLEFVPGETLQARLRRLSLAGQRMPLDDVLQITASVADAVDYAHQQGLIHRDIKPGNVMLNPQGQAVLMDFGVAKIVGGAQHTATGAVVGTATYISPEQVLGQRPTERSDIYSLGVTLFEMVVGKLPFEADSAMSLMLKHVNAPPPNIHELRPDTPRDVVAIVQKALAKDPADRFQTGRQMAAALRAALQRLRNPAADQQRVAAASARADTRTNAIAAAEAAPRKFPLWALIGLPIVALLCLAVTVAAAVATVANLRPTPTQLAQTATTAAVVPSQTVAPTVAGATVAPSATAAAVATTAVATTAPTAAVPAGMLSVAGGTFQMGSIEGANDERPVHSVTLDPFFIDPFEVTNERYLACVDDGACSRPAQLGSFTRARYFNDAAFAQFPVVQVTWDQAQEFCEWDGGKRLPTEAEWEFAATGGDGRRYPWGSEFDTKRLPALHQDTLQVGSFQDGVSPIGAFDMAGNVLEWVGDLYDPKFYGESVALNPGGPDDGSEHVLRGGSFGNADGQFYTTTRRYHLTNGASDADVGFRCAQLAP